MALIGKSRGKREPAPRWEPEPGKKVVLHVGCGAPDPEKVDPRYRGPQWQELRLDIDPRVAPDILASITDMEPVPARSVDAIWSSHNIEHVSWHEVPAVLREFFRVLRPGGEALIATPDLQFLAKAIANEQLEDPMYDTDMGPIAPIDMIYGHRRSIAADQGSGFMAHKTGFTRKTLEAKLRDVGFGEIKITRDTGELLALARRPT